MARRLARGAKCGAPHQALRIPLCDTFNMPSVQIETAHSVRTVRLNAPDRLNAVDETLLGALHGALEAAYAAPEIRAVILTGAGAGFCAGANLSAAPDEISADDVRALIQGTVNPLIAGMRAARKPIIVAVNGAAVGFGMALALAGDIVLAARSARFALGFVRVGAVLDGGASLMLERIVGAGRARGLALLGPTINADTAAQWGLAWRVVEDGDLMREAHAVAMELADNAPAAVGAIKAQLERIHGASLEEALKMEAERQSAAFAGPDFRAAVQKFQARGEPKR